MFFKIWGKNPSLPNVRICVHYPKVRDAAVLHPAFRTQVTDLSPYCYRRGGFIGLFPL